MLLRPSRAESSRNFPFHLTHMVFESKLASTKKIHKNTLWVKLLDTTVFFQKARRPLFSCLKVRCEQNTEYWQLTLGFIPLIQRRQWARGLWGALGLSWSATAGSVLHQALLHSCRTVHGQGDTGWADAQRLQVNWEQVQFLPLATAKSSWDGPH